MTRYIIRPRSTGNQQNVMTDEYMNKLIFLLWRCVERDLESSM